MAEWSKAPIFVSRLLACCRFEPRSLRKLYARKFPVTCGRMVVLLSLNYSTNKTRKAINNLKCVDMTSFNSILL